MINNNKIIKEYIFSSETFKILNNFSWWVQNSYQHYSGAKDWLKELDNIASYFEKTENNKIILTTKAKNFCKENKKWHDIDQESLNRKERETERKIFSFFSELKAADELKLNGYNNINFINTTEKKTPDLSVVIINADCFVEVKRLQNPHEEDEKLRSTGQHKGAVRPDFKASLENKINYFITDAKEKFSNCGHNLKQKQKILIIDFDPGIDARLSKDVNNFSPSLTNIFTKDDLKKFETDNNITIWPRKYF